MSSLILFFFSLFYFVSLLSIFVISCLIGVTMWFCFVVLVWVGFWKVL